MRHTPSMVSPVPPLAPTGSLAWRQHNVGRLLNNAVRRFEDRVLAILAQQSLPHLAPSHINATRHLDLDGTRLTELARRAAMTKQSMSELVSQLVQLGIVARHPDPLDTRARQICFTPLGLRWLHAFGAAVAQAEAELCDCVGADAATQLTLALQRYTR